MYREFVDEASKSYIDSITSHTPDLTRLGALYALISRMRSLSSPGVIDEAEKVAQLIVRSYAEPNMTFADLRPMITAKAIDPLRSFSESCREELERLKYKGSLWIDRLTQKLAKANNGRPEHPLMR